LFNVLDNSLRYGARTVRVSFARHGGDLLMQVHDDGPGVSPEQHARMQQALASQAYEQAVGLGLMLTDLVLRAHRGSLALMATHSGFSLMLRWPDPPADAGSDAALVPPPAA
jgi:K+-sensing histidine kinase KdpD